jgi:hypothetical protein
MATTTGIDSGALDGQPYWTERLFAPRSGVDHLGLGSVVTDRILPRLSPGVNVLTTHPRYWSFYAFLLSEFWDRDLPRTRAAYRAFHRPRECLHSVACSLCQHPGHRGNPPGVNKIGPIVAGAPDAYDPQLDYMKSPLGGYGLYYATVMESLGLTHLQAPKLGLPWDTPTAAGQTLAAAFRSAIADTEYYTTWFDRPDDQIPASVLEEYAEVGCFCRLRDDAPDRPLLVDAFLHGGTADDAAARRATFQFVGSLADHDEDHQLSSPVYRRLVYFRMDHVDEDGTLTEPVHPPQELQSVARRWRLYQAREYFNFGLNSLWRWVADWGMDHEGDLQPLPRTALDAAIDHMDLDAALGWLGHPPVGFDASTPVGDLLTWLLDAAAHSGSLDDPWDLAADVTEDALVDHFGRGEEGNGAAGSGPDALGGAILLLLLVSARLLPPELALAAGEDWFVVAAGGPDRIPMQQFLTRLRADAVAGTSVGDVTRRILDQDVIGQHSRIAMGKLASTGDTFRFRREGSRLRFFPNDTYFRMNDSRFNALATVLYELGWTGYLYEEGHGLTAEGAALVTAGDLPPAGLYEPEGAAEADT